MIDPPGLQVPGSSPSAGRDVATTKSVPTLRGTPSKSATLMHDPEIMP